MQITNHEIWLAHGRKLKWPPNLNETVNLFLHAMYAKNRLLRWCRENGGPVGRHANAAALVEEEHKHMMAPCFLRRWVDEDVVISEKLLTDYFDSLSGWKEDEEEHLHQEAQRWRERKRKLEEEEEETRRASGYYVLRPVSPVSSSSSSSSSDAPRPKTPTLVPAAENDGVRAAAEAAAEKAYIRAVRKYHRRLCQCGNEAATGCDKCGRCCPGCERHGHGRKVDSTTKSGEEDCVICLVASRSHAMMPCGHRCVCEECGARVLMTKRREGRVCPMCRTKCSECVRIFT
jgi:hypothetical protein